MFRTDVDDVEGKRIKQRKFGDIGEQIVFRKEHNFNKKLTLSKIGAKETPHWGVDRPGDVVACSCCLDFPLSGLESGLVQRLHKV